MPEKNLQNLRQSGVHLETPPPPPPPGEEEQEEEEEEEEERGEEKVDMCLRAYVNLLYMYTYA